jgi:protein-S-isoprenylcysteine O-methyltransferase Ste14
MPSSPGPQAWVFMALFIGCSKAIGVWLKKTDPDLLAARMKSPISADQKFSGRAVMSAILVVFIGWFGFMAVDARRCGWSHTPLWAQALGAALIVGAFYGWVGVLRANSFDAVTVRLQVMGQQFGLAFDEIGTSRRRNTEVRLTHRWREMDSNFKFRAK